MDVTKLWQTPLTVLYISRKLSLITRKLHTMSSLKTKHDKSMELSGQSYKDAVAALNSLQSNAQVRKELAAQRGTRNEESLPEMRMFLETIGISNERLKSLNTIHVAGSKGKGTTCAFTESILRNAGLRTGFYSSPHLAVVRERIKINGIPISPEKFAKHFFPVYNRLLSRKEKDDDFPMPPYFRFLTCMAFYVFLEENVDVAIIEVGIGGRYDCTNVIPNPTVVGITSLGLEHQAILGQTLEEIAWSKAGIMKEKSPTFTVPSHPCSILKLLQDEAANVKCPFYVSPTLDEFPENLKISVDDGKVSRLNAAVAIQLTSSFISQKFPEKMNLSGNQKGDNNGVFRKLFQFHISGLESTYWPGRFQVINMSENLKYYLDGAHTMDSLSVALDWFKNMSNADSFRVLIFNVTGERSGFELLTNFTNSKVFNLGLFCPVRRRNTTPDLDNWNILSDGTDLLTQCEKYNDYWKSFNKNSLGHALDNIESALDFVQALSNNKSDAPYLTNNIDDGLPKQKNNRSVEVLVTGSLHLVGNVLSILNPSLNDDKT